MCLLVLAGAFAILALTPFPENGSVRNWVEYSEIWRNYFLAGAGLAATIGLWLAYVRTRAADQQARVAQEAHFTDLFTKAIEQLGNDKSLAVRLGGIRALERIAADSPKDRWPIVKFCAAYVRENAKWPQDENWEPVPSHCNPRDTLEVPQDIQAAIDVIGTVKSLDPSLIDEMALIYLTNAPSIRILKAGGYDDAEP